MKGSNRDWLFRVEVIIPFIYLKKFNYTVKYPEYGFFKNSNSLRIWSSRVKKKSTCSFTPKIFTV